MSPRIELPAQWTPLMQEKAENVSKSLQRRAQVQGDSLIGESTMSGGSMPNLSTLAGKSAVKVLKSDVATARRSLRGRSNYNKMTRDVLAAHHAVTLAALSLHPRAVLANDLSGSDREDVRGWLADDVIFSEFSMNHYVWVPFRPGGYLMINVSINDNVNGEIEWGFHVQIEYHGIGSAGDEADFRPEFRKRNEAIFELVGEYLMEAANKEHDMVELLKAH